MQQDEVLIGDFRRSWMIRRRGETTIRNYTYSLRRISSWLAEQDRTLSTAERRDLEAFIELRLEQVAPRTAHTDFKAMRAFYKWAVEDQDIDIGRNPTLNIKGPEIPTEETEQLPPVVDERAYRQLVKACRTTAKMTIDERARAVRDHTIITMLWWTGMRRSELCRLDVGDVDLDASELRVYKRTKTGKPRIVPILSMEFMEVLDRWVRYRRAYRAEEPALFIGVGRNAKKGRDRLQPNGVTQLLARRAKQAGVHAPSHGFRRGRAEQLDRDGAEGVHIDRMLGWTDERQRRRYTRANGQRLSNDALRVLYEDA